MRIWQPGSYMTRQRGAEVDDWSWGQTSRRIRTLAQLTKPYKLRTALALITLLAATATLLAPPYLVKIGIDLDLGEHGSMRMHGVDGLRRRVRGALAAGAEPFCPPTPWDSPSRSRPRPALRPTTLHRIGADPSAECSRRKAGEPGPDDGAACRSCCPGRTDTGVRREGY